MASVTQPGIKYYNLQLDELQKVITTESMAKCSWWSKFSPHISRLSAKITKLAPHRDVSELELRVEQFKAQLMQKAFEGLQQQVTELKGRFIVTPTRIIPIYPEGAYRQVLSLAAEVECFTKDCPTFHLEGTDKSILAFKSQMETYWSMYRNPEPIPQVEKVAVYVLGKSINFPITHIRFQIRQMRTELEQDEVYSSRKYCQQFEKFDELIAELEDSGDNFAPWRFTSLRRELTDSRIFVLNAQIQKYWGGFSKCTFRQCRAIKKEIISLKAGNVTEIQFVDLIVLEQEQEGLLKTIEKSCQKHVARRPKKTTVDLDSLKNWRRPPSTDSESSTRSCRHSTDSDSDTRGDQPKGKYVYRAKK